VRQFGCIEVALSDALILRDELRPLAKVDPYDARSMMVLCEKLYEAILKLKSEDADTVNIALEEHEALIVNHFVLMAQFGLLNTWLGVILPQLIAPVVVIVYKQFFDSVPREYREAAVIDGANDFQLLFRVFLPMNWGVTTALAIITFIGAWNAFLWPFLATKTEDMMTVTVGITEVQDAFGVYYAKLLAGAVMAGLPVALAYLIFQRRVTQAITLSAGIKG